MEVSPESSEGSPMTPDSPPTPKTPTTPPRPTKTKTPTVPPKPMSAKTPKTKATSPTPSSPKTPRSSTVTPTSPKTPRSSTITPTSPKTPRSSTITPTSPKTPKSPTSTDPDDHVFKTSLKVLLKKQNEELAKNIDFKKKQELDNEENDDNPLPEDIENGAKDRDVSKEKNRKENHNKMKDAIDNNNDNKKDVRERDDKQKTPKGHLNKEKKEWKKREKEVTTREKERISNNESKEAKRIKRDDKESRQNISRKEEEKGEKAEEKKVRDKDKRERENKELKGSRDDKKNKEKIKTKENVESKDRKGKRDNTESKDQAGGKEKLEDNEKTKDKAKTKDKEKTEVREKKESVGRDKVHTPGAAVKTVDGEPEARVKTVDGEPGARVKTGDGEPGARVKTGDGEPGARVKTGDGEPGARVKTGSRGTPQQQQRTGKSQGFLLLKKKGPFSSWKRYFFILDGQLLTYYRTQQDFGQLSVLKGSLDLAMLEEVRSKNPGLLKTHFPFQLSRRNLPSLQLAADSREERERWLGLLQDILARGANRLSTHNSDRTLHTGLPFASIDSSDQPAKSATLPGRTLYPSEDAGSSSSDQDQPQLIKPKKLPRVPITGPLAGINIAEVNLKKVQPMKKTDEMKQAADDTDSSSSDQSDDEPKVVRAKKVPTVPLAGARLKKVDRPSKKLKERETKDAEKENQKQKEDPLSAGEKFGVKLKKIQKNEGVVEKEIAENKQEDLGVHQKRVVKQPNIPLNSSNFLSRSDVKLPKMSPVNQKKGTTERKKSPSPNIPLSKSVHSLTKTVEAADTSANVLYGASTENVDSEEEGEKDLNKTITIHHAESFEIKCTDEVVSIDEKECIDSDSLARSAVLVPQVSIRMSEHLDEELEQDDFDEEFLKNIEQIAEFASTPSETKPLTQEEHECDVLDEESLTMPAQLPLPGGTSDTPSPTPSSTKEDSPLLQPKSLPSPYPAPADMTQLPSTPQDDDEHVHKEFDQYFSNSLKTPYKPPTPPSVASSSSETLRASAAKDVTAEKGVTPPRSPIRGRTNTNESTNSSCKSDSESADKRSSKFKLFRTKRSGSISSADKKEIGEIKDPKDTKAKGSSTLSKILHVTKSKDKKKKENKDENAKPVDKPKDSNPKLITDSKDEPEIEAIPDETKETQDPLKCIESNVTQHQGPEILLSNMDDNNELRLEDLSPCRQENPETLAVVMRHDIQYTSEESRCSTYSRTSNSSRDQEPAPSIPEKTRVRAKSPSHDIPQSNRPVTNLYHLISPQEQEVEDRKPVDGYISEKQIQAILSASETRDKRRLSQSRIQGNTLAVPDGSKASGGNDGKEEWMYKRPSYLSINSMESDEPLPATNFISGDRLSSSSGSFRAMSKSYDSDSSGESHQVSRDIENTLPEQEASAVPLRTTSRLAESLTVGNRVSLTSPEFTVVEEDGPGSPDATKTTFPFGTEPEGQNTSSEATTKIRFSVGNEEEEEEDYFPVVGGDVELRKSPIDLSLSKSSGGEVRTSGIVGLKEYLKTIEPEEQEIEVKSSISRLGHSAAVEKLKETSDEL